MTESELDHLIKTYFTGELNNKINYLHQKYKQKFTDDRYCSLKAFRLGRVGKNLNNNINDPTGGIATRLADIKLEQRKNYEYYLKFYQSMNDYIKNLDNHLINNIKIYLGIIDNNLLDNDKRMVEIQFKKIKNAFMKMRILDK